MSKKRINEKAIRRNVLNSPTGTIGPIKVNINGVITTSGKIAIKRPSKKR